MRPRLRVGEPGVIGRDLDPEGPTPQQFRPLKHWEERERNRQEDRADLLNVWRQIEQHFGGMLALNRAAAKGDVLGQMTQQIPANGVLQKQWSQNFQSVTVANFGLATLTVTSQGLQSQAPGVGSGVAEVAGGFERTLALRGNAITIYGLPGSIVEFTAYVRPRPPHAAPVGSGTTDGILVPNGATTTQIVSLSQLAAERLVVVQNVSAVTGSLQVTINGVTPSGYVYPVLVGAAVVAAGVTELRVGPGLTAAANAVANDVVPRELQIVATAVAPVTYGLDFVAGR